MSEDVKIPAERWFSIPGLTLLYEPKDFKHHNLEITGFNDGFLYLCHFNKRLPDKSQFTAIALEDIQQAEVKTSFRISKVIIGLVLLLFGLGWIGLFVSGGIDFIMYWIAGLSALGGLFTLLTPFEHHGLFEIKDRTRPLKSGELSWKSKKKLSQHLRNKGIID